MPRPTVAVVMRVNSFPMICAAFGGVRRLVPLLVPCVFRNVVMRCCSSCVRFESDLPETSEGASSQNMES
jgi:hypothetical protein